MSNGKKNFFYIASLKTVTNMSCLRSSSHSSTNS